MNPFDKFTSFPVFGPVVWFANPAEYLYRAFKTPADAERSMKAMTNLTMDAWTRTLDAWGVGPNRNWMNGLGK